MPNRLYRQLVAKGLAEFSGIDGKTTIRITEAGERRVLNGR